MDIALSSLAVQQGQSHLSAGQSAVKMAAKSEQAIAAILETAITPASGATGSRGTQLDITI